MVGWTTLLWALGLALPLAHAYTLETFHENLSLRPLPDGKVSSLFSFVVNVHGATSELPNSALDDESQHHSLLPLSLSQIIREYAVSELHLTLNAGDWDYDRWGHPEEQNVGTGAELWAWMRQVNGSDDSGSARRWQGLRNSLAGLFCASLGSLDNQRTTSPDFIFPPGISLTNKAFLSSHFLSHASLPSESVCTENLTPFLKLLPCKSSSGLASLLNPHRIFDADWHGMGVHVISSEGNGIEAKFTIQAVFDPTRLTGGKRDWTLNSLFGRTITKSCPIASSSRVLVRSPLREDYQLRPEPSLRDSQAAIYGITNISEPLDISMTWSSEEKFEFPLSASDSHARVTVRRILNGVTQSHAELSVVFKNNLPETTEVAYFESMPWLMQFYLHTLHIASTNGSQNELLSDIAFIPAVPHGRPTMLQLTLKLPANATVSLSLYVTKSFLLYTEHPPDAQRGWDLPPAVVVTGLGGSKPQRIYTPALLVDLATPDFSMPYNVIIMTCTLIALIFGTIFNILVRKFTLVNLQDAPVAIVLEGR